MLLDAFIWLAIALVISLRSLAVYSHHFIQDTALRSARERFLSWFRFYKRGFSVTLGLVAFFLAGVSFLDGSIPWTLGNLVFGLAAFIDFQKHNAQPVAKLLKGILSSKLGSRIFFFVIPISLFVYLFRVNALNPNSWSGFSGLAFSYTGAYLLALVFLSMKLELWGALSHEAWPYLVGVMVWDVLLFAGAVLDGNVPFMVLESYAILLDGVTFFLIKALPAKLQIT